MTNEASIVFIVDDDPRVCEAISDLLAARSIETAAFHSIAQYRIFERPDRAACLLLDIELPDVSGIEFGRDGLEMDEVLSRHRIDPSDLVLFD